MNGEGSFRDRKCPLAFAIGAKKRYSVDLAKNVFALHGVNETGAVQLRQPKVARAKLNAMVAALPPCVIGLEACSGAHHWARLFAAHGHSVKLMAPKLVVPYRMSGKRGKNDAADAAAKCTTSTSASSSTTRTSARWPRTAPPRSN